MSISYFWGYLRHIVPMILTIAGFYLFTVRREGCERKFVLTTLVTLVLEYVIYYFMLTEDAGGQGIMISKILTTIMISLQIFWGGLYVYGGWARIGIYIFATDMILGITDRLYWLSWQYFTHRTADRDLIYFKESTVYDPMILLYYLVDFLIIIPLLLGGYKLRNRPLRPAWLFKTAVIVYLSMGMVMSRPGYEGSFGGAVYFIEIAWVILFFLLAVTMLITAARENERIFYIRKLVVTEQSQLLMLQKEKVRRLRHDLRKHLSNLEYILEKEPDLRADSAFLRYQEKLRAYEKWMKGSFYCSSTVVNLCFEQMKRYCDERGIVFDVVLKRLHYAGWREEDQLMFGTLLFNLLQVFCSTRPVAAVHYAGDCLMGQNILRITMDGGAVEVPVGGTGADPAAGTAVDPAAGASADFVAGVSEDPAVGAASGIDGETAAVQDTLKAREITSNDQTKDRKLVSNLEKDIRLILSRYEGRMEREDHGRLPAYVFSWKDGNETR